MQIVVPFAVEEPKTRLSPLFDPDERRAFARAMLEDVLRAIRDTGHEPTVLATAPLEVDAAVNVDDRPLSVAVNAVLDASAEPVAVVMADLALATPESLERLFSRGADGNPAITVAPGRGGGTNALVVRHPDFRVDYHGASYLDHCRIAEEVGASLEPVDSARLATDVDEPADLVEVLIHGGDRSRAFLEAGGWSLESGDGRVRLGRDSGTRNLIERDRRE